MLTPLGYLTENANTPYPFKEGCSLLPVGSKIPLNNDLFVDFQFTTSDPTARRVALAQLRSYVKDDEHTVGIVLAILQYDSTTGLWSKLLKTITRISGEMTLNNFFYEDFGAYKVKIVPGAGMLGLFQGQILNYTFTVDPFAGKVSAEFSPSTVYPVQPYVSRVHFKNTRDPADVLNVVLNGDLNLWAGANVEFEPHTGETGLIVKKGAGTGLYDACIDLPTGVIKGINGIGGENFVFSTGDCYQTVFRPNEHGMEFIHTCRPKCTQTEVSAFAYYVNRIQDAANKMSAYIKKIVDGLKAQLAAIEAAKAVAIAPTPYVEVQNASTRYNNRAYESIGIGVYDPNKRKLTTTLKATFSGGVNDAAYLADNPDYTGWVLHPNSLTLKEENSSYVLPVSIIDGEYISVFDHRGVDCRSSVLSNLIVSVPNTIVDGYVKVALLTYDDEDVITSTAFKYQTLQPSAQPYFNVRSRRGLRTVGAVTTYVYTVTVDLFNANPLWSGNTDFSVYVGFGPTISNPVVRINNGTAEAMENSGSVISFSDKTINYPERASVTFNLEAPTSGAVSLTLRMVVGDQVVALGGLAFT